MSGIFQALTSVATAAAAQATARTVKRFVWAAIGGLCVLVGVIFAAAAGYQALAETYGPLMAKLWIAAAFLLVGLAIFVVQAIYNRRGRRKAATSGATTSVAVAFAMGLLSGLGRRGR